MVSIWQFILDGPASTCGPRVAKTADMYANIFFYLVGPRRNILPCYTHSGSPREGDRLSNPSLYGTRKQSKKAS
jgi:hypothetical protein